MTKVVKVVRKQIIRDEDYSELPYLARLKCRLLWEQDRGFINNLNISPEYDLKAINGGSVARYIPLATFVRHTAQSGSKEIAVDRIEFQDEAHKFLMHFFTVQYGIEVLDVYKYFPPVKFKN